MLALVCYTSIYIQAYRKRGCIWVGGAAPEPGVQRGAEPKYGIKTNTVSWSLVYHRFMKASRNGPGDIIVPRGLTWLSTSLHGCDPMIWSTVLYVYIPFEGIVDSLLDITLQSWSQRQFMGIRDESGSIYLSFCAYGLF